MKVIHLILVIVSLSGHFTIDGRRVFTTNHRRSREIQEKTILIYNMMKYQQQTSMSCTSNLQIDPVLIRDLKQITLMKPNKKKQFLSFDDKDQFACYAAAS